MQDQLAARLSQIERRPEPSPLLVDIKRIVVRRTGHDRQHLQWRRDFEGRIFQWQVEVANDGRVGRQRQEAVVLSIENVLPGQVGKFGYFAEVETEAQTRTSAARCRQAVAQAQQDLVGKDRVEQPPTDALQVRQSA